MRGITNGIRTFNKEITSQVKVWRFTKTKASEIRVRIHCNDVELANIALSGSFCGDNDWTYKWARDFSQIFISDQYDRASDFYRPYQVRAGKLLMTPCSFDKNQMASSLDSGLFFFFNSMSCFHLKSFS